MYYFKEPNTRPLAIACVVVLALLVFFLVWFSLMPTITEPTETLYPLAVRVSTIDREADVVKCIDGAGNVWEFFGCEDWQEGDFAALLMNDKGTPSIYDDEIITARYAGVFEG